MRKFSGELKSGVAINSRNGHNDVRAPVFILTSRWSRRISEVFVKIQKKWGWERMGSRRGGGGGQGGCERRIEVFVKIKNK